MTEGTPARIEIAPGYAVPRVVIGLWQLSEGHRAGGAAAAADRLRALERFVDAGLDTFDCADIYTGVEETLGRLRRSRPGIRIHTKFVPDRAVLPTIDRAHVVGVIDRSLRRLGVERIDLVQFHWWDWGVPGWIDAAGWLDRLREEGKIRLVGATNFDASHLQALRDAGVHPVTDQVQYSLLDRRPERSLVGDAERNGSWLLCYGSLAGGFLGSRWIDAAEPGPPWANRSLEKYALIVEDAGGWEAFQGLLGALDEIARRHGADPSAVAVRAVLDRPRVAAAIVGAADDRHLESIRAVLDLRLDEADRDRIAEALRDLPGPPGEIYELERVVGGRHASIMRMNLNRAAGPLA